MNYNNQELINMLSAEYVLGTLRGSARKRFQRLILTSTRVRETTWLWEQYLNAITDSIKEVPPNPDVWQKILQRIEPLKKSQSTQSNVVPITSRIWQTVAFSAIAATFVLALFLLQPSAPLQQITQQVALIQNTQKEVLWLIDVKQEKLQVKASAQLNFRTDRDYELWMILKGQDKPISLGILPKDGMIHLAKNSQFNVDDISLLAVSLEPLGGSPNGLPSEVLYTTELMLL